MGKISTQTEDTTPSDNDLILTVDAESGSNKKVKKSNLYHAASPIQTDEIADSAVTTGKVNDGAITNAKLNTAAGELGGVWQDWTPSFANITVGNGTLVAKCTQRGKTVHFRLKITAGSTTSFATSATVSVPVTANSAYSDAGGFHSIPGGCAAKDVTGSLFDGLLYFVASATVVSLRWLDGTANTSATFPFTEAAGDFLYLGGIYEAA